MRKRIACCIALGIACSGGLGAAELPGLSAYAAVASEYVYNGLQRSQGEAIVKARVGVASESGWSASIAASTLDFNPGPGPAREVDLYVAKALELRPDWRLVLALADYDFGPDGRTASYDYREAGVTVGWRETLEISLQFSPDYTSFSRGGIHHRQDVWTVEGSLRYPLRPGWEFDAGFGHRDLQALDVAYWYWSAGTVLTRGRYSFALTYINSDGVARSAFRSAARDRVVATLALRLH